MAEFAGDYDLQYVHIHSHRGEGLTNRVKGENISNMVVELNVYESIYNQALTGTVVITDAIDLISTLPLTGNERLAFKFHTPRGQIDASSETGHPFHIFKLTDKQQLFLDSNVSLALTNQRIGVEYMDTAAACRSFNILLSEERSVVGIFYMIV